MHACDGQVAWLSDVRQMSGDLASCRSCNAAGFTLNMVYRHCYLLLDLHRLHEAHRWSQGTNQSDCICICHLVYATHDASQQQSLCITVPAWRLPSCTSAPHKASPYTIDCARHLHICPQCVTFDSNLCHANTVLQWSSVSWYLISLSHHQLTDHPLLYTLACIDRAASLQKAYNMASNIISNNKIVTTFSGCTLQGHHYSSHAMLLTCSMRVNKKTWKQSSV